MAFHAYLNGECEAERISERLNAPRRIKTVLANQAISVCDIPGLFDDNFSECLGLWLKWKTLGCMPYAGGFKEQPGAISEILYMLESIFLSRSKNGNS